MPTTVKKDRDLSAAFGSVGGAHWATEPGSHMDELAMASRRHSGLESPRVTTRSPCTVTRESVCGNEDLSTAKEKY